MKQKFTFYSDLGHGWLRVNLGLLRTWKIELDVFTKYSYVDEKYAYLEEDCDYARFMDRVPEGVTIEIVERASVSDSPSPIRKKASMGFMHKIDHFKISGNQ